MLAPQQMTVPSLLRAQVAVSLETSFRVVVWHAAPHVPGGQLHTSMPLPTVTACPPFSHTMSHSVAFGSLVVVYSGHVAHLRSLVGEPSLST
jgi:hypothetical protein